MPATADVWKTEILGENEVPGGTGRRFRQLQRTTENNVYILTGITTTLREFASDPKDPDIQPQRLYISDLSRSPRPSEDREKANSWWADTLENPMQPLGKYKY